MFIDEIDPSQVAAAAAARAAMTGSGADPEPAHRDGWLWQLVARRHVWLQPTARDPGPGLLTAPAVSDRRVPVDYRTCWAAEAIPRAHAKKIKVAEDVDFNNIGAVCLLASGARALANLVNEAALRAVINARRSSPRQTDGDH